MTFWKFDVLQDCFIVKLIVYQLFPGAALRAGQGVIWTPGLAIFLIYKIKNLKKKLFWLP